MENKINKRITTLTYITFGSAFFSVGCFITMLVRIEPFRLTNDAILGGSLGVISLLTAIIFTVQIIDRNSIHKMNEELNRKSSELDRRIMEVEKQHIASQANNQFSQAMILSDTNPLSAFSCYNRAIYLFFEVDDSYSVNACINNMRLTINNYNFRPYKINWEEKLYKQEYQLLNNSLEKLRLHPMYFYIKDILNILSNSLKI